MWIFFLFLFCPSFGPSFLPSFSYLFINFKPRRGFIQIPGTSSTLKNQYSQGIVLNYHSQQAKLTRLCTSWKEISATMSPTLFKWITCELTEILICLSKITYWQMPYIPQYYAICLKNIAKQILQKEMEFLQAIKVISKKIFICYWQKKMLP